MSENSTSFTEDLRRRGRPTFATEIEEAATYMARALSRDAMRALNAAWARAEREVSWKHGDAA